jgi:O-acetyl-ADP-ribose deacetylase (regulator of RNase III)
VVAALDAAREQGARSVALPAISAGIYGYPPEDAAVVIAEAAVSWLRDGPVGSVAEVRLVGFDTAAAQRFADALPE